MINYSIVMRSVNANLQEINQADKTGNAPPLSVTYYA